MALTVTEIAMEHKAAARRGMMTAMDLLSELEAAVLANDVIAAELHDCRRDDPQRAVLINKMLGVRARVETLDKWAGAFTKLSAIERDESQR